jgi:hypothetical protein
MCEDRRMASHPPGASDELSSRLASLGRRLGEREAEHGPSIERARAEAEQVRAQVEVALAAFHHAAALAGAPHLKIALGKVHTDEKHLRSVEFDVTRGQHRAIVICKSKGDVTYVGPFRMGKNEGPCRTLAVDAADDRDAALAEFLERFLEEAATP